jgi:hypothetical protein
MQGQQWQISMKSEKAEIKERLAEKLEAYYGAGFKTILSERSGYSYETVRKYFKHPQRVNDAIENQAFMLVDEAKAEAEAKLNRLES